MRKILVSAFAAILLGYLSPMAVTAQQPTSSPVGKWRTIDDETGRAKSIVEIQRQTDGTYTGRIIELLNPSRPNPTCDKCKDDRKNKPITGMEIIRGMKADGGDEYSGGTILKPDEGKVYKSKMKLIDGGSKLEVSGCIAFICKSQVWLRQ